MVAGVNDPIQPYDGWLTELRRLLSIPETMEFWRQQHGCTGQTRKLLPHLNQADGTRVALWEWTGCKTPNAVKLYRVAGGGHQVPSFTPADPEWVRQAGAQTRDIETIDEFWNFAKQFSRRSTGTALPVNRERDRAGRGRRNADARADRREGQSIVARDAHQHAPGHNGG